ARALQLAGFTRISGVVALGATISMSAVLLVFQYGQPRIFFAMGRDGLLPAWAARVHPRTRVPAVTTLITGIFVALWAVVGDAGGEEDSALVLGYCCARKTRMCAAVFGDSITSTPLAINAAPVALPSRPRSTDRTVYVAPGWSSAGRTLTVPLLSSAW